MVYWKVQKYDRVTLKSRRPQNSFAFSTQNNHNNSDDSFRVSNANMVRAASGVSYNEEEYYDDASSEDFKVRFAPANQPPLPHEQQEQQQNDKGQNETKSSWMPSLVNVREILADWRRRRELFREDHPRTYEVFQQSLWYLGVFYITHIWSTSNRTIQLINNGNTYYGLIVLHSFFDPLQGFLNYLVYQRPRYLRIRAFDPNMSRWQALRKALTFSRFGGAEMSTGTLSRTTAQRRSSKLTSSLRKSRNSSSGASPDSDVDTGLSNTADLLSIDFSVEKSLGIIVEEDSSDLHESHSQAAFKEAATATHTTEETHRDAGESTDDISSESTAVSVAKLETELREKKLVR